MGEKIWQALGVMHLTRTGSSALRVRTQKPLRGFRAAAASVTRLKDLQLCLLQKYGNAVQLVA